MPRNGQMLAQRRPRPRGHGAAVAVVALVVAALAASCAVPIADLGGPSSGAAGINDAGIVVGSSELPGSTPEAFVSRAYKRLPDNSVVDLGTLDGFTSSDAWRINAGGVVVGTASGPSGSHAVRWEADGQIVDLGPGEAWDINDAGVVVGQSALLRGFAFDPATGHQIAMPDLPGAIQSEARGINNLGQVVGFQSMNGPTAAVLWDLETGVVTDLGETLTEVFLPFDINDAGTMVGTVRTGSPNRYQAQAALLPVGWTAPINLGVGGFSVAAALNESNTVVISRLTTQQAFRWQPISGLVEIGGESSSLVLDVNEDGTMVGQDTGRAALFGVPPAS